MNRSYVAEGVVLRQSPDNTHPDSPDYPQQRGCARGRSLRHAVFASDRLKYPLKRKHWQPGGGENSQGHLRGRDEWERITWDEALDYIASEVTRIKNDYGMKSILSTGYEIRTLVDRMYYAPSLSAYGGCTFTWGQASQGAFPLVSNMMKGSFDLGRMDYSDRFDLLEADLVVMWGHNPSWSIMGNTSYFYLRAKQAGAKFIFVDPWCNPTMQALADEWVPVRPGTDTALLLAVAYVLIRDGLQDQDFLDRCCVGFDADHMPEGAPREGNFRDYVLGTYDGQPKTPEWAQPVCGVPAARIEWLAREMGTANRVTLRASQAPARTDNGATFVQAFYTVGWMCGACGLPGAEVSAGAGGYVGFGGPALVEPGDRGAEWPVNPICEPPRGAGQLAAGNYDPSKYYGIAMAEMWDAIVDGEFTNFSHGKEPIDIRMLWKVGEGGRINQNPAFNRAVEAFRSVEFVVSSDLWFTSDCRYSDIVLPSTSFWEVDGFVQPKTNRELLYYTSKIHEPLFECHEDLEVEAAIGERWGIDPAVVNPLSVREMGLNQILGARVVANWERQGEGVTCSDSPRLAESATGAYQSLWNCAWDAPALALGDSPSASDLVDDSSDQGGIAASGLGSEGFEWEFLLDVTREDLEGLGVEGEVHSGLVPLREFLETGVYQVPRALGDGFGHVRYAEFRADPDGCPLNTESGKFEIYCGAIARQYERFGLSRVAPIAQYVPAREGYEDTFADWDAQVKGEYPLQNLSIHFIGRAHQAFDNVMQLREVFPHDVLMNQLDAQAAGVSQGDTVLVESPHGRILRRVRVTSLLIPGVVVLGEGAWSDVVDGDIDRSGNANSLERSSLSGEGQCTWNSSVCRVLPWDGEPLPPDYRSADRRGAGIASVMPARGRKASEAARNAAARLAQVQLPVAPLGGLPEELRDGGAKRLVKDDMPSSAARGRQTFGNAAKLRFWPQGDGAPDTSSEEGGAR
ncbi:MAG: molybdopterin-dependent oxidoreductase [Coriobacteriia bacterium]|nr:molybdopterin-dependent oxidoreductase [Coriobacteriia bacterium]